MVRSDFAPMGDIPTGVKLTSYAREASDVTPESLPTFVDDVAAGRQKLDLGRTFQLEEIAEALLYGEQSGAWQAGRRYRRRLKLQLNLVPHF